MWFFLMLGLPLKYSAGKTQGRTVEPAAIRIVETNRYSIVARNVVDLLNAGDFSAIQALFNSQMSTALPPKEADKFFTKLIDGYGTVRTFEGPTGDGYLDWTAFRLHCQRGTLTMSLALDADDKISGIYFRPAARPFEFRSLLLQLFSWQRLVWVVPFFLAGLLFARLLQKTTERAVGISILGIHLLKGQNILLWDEIKEVRPLRILNIHSLWLIKNAGEKTIMPWTSLERHADILTAIESCAPFDHPIRKHLSLLKRI